MLYNSPTASSSVGLRYADFTEKSPFSSASHTTLSMNIFVIHTFHDNWLWNQLSVWPTSQILHKSLHRQECVILWLGMFLLALVSYLDSSTSLHIPKESTFNFHIHFSISALLKLLTSLIPKPPSFFGLHKVFHLIQAIFFSLTSHPHINLLCKLVISLQIDIGALKRDK